MLLWYSVKLHSEIHASRDIEGKTGKEEDEKKDKQLEILQTKSGGLGTRHLKVRKTLYDRKQARNIVKARLLFENISQKLWHKRNKIEGSLWVPTAEAVVAQAWNCTIGPLPLTRRRRDENQREHKKRGETREGQKMSMCREKRNQGEKAKRISKEDQTRDSSTESPQYNPVIKASVMTHMSPHLLWTTGTLLAAWWLSIHFIAANQAICSRLRPTRWLQAHRKK